MPCQACNNAGGGSPSIQDVMAHAEAALHQLKEVVEKECWQKQGIRAALHSKEAQLQVQLVHSMSSALLLDITRRMSHDNVACLHVKPNALTAFCTAPWHAACCKLTSIPRHGPQLHGTFEADSIPSQLARMNDNCQRLQLDSTASQLDVCQRVVYKAECLSGSRVCIRSWTA